MPEGRIKIEEPNLSAGKKAGQEIIAKLEPAVKDHFGREFEIKKHKVDESSSSWGQEISVRKGNNIGAGIEVDYSSVFDKNHVKIEVSASTKTGNILFYAMAVVFALLGCFVGDFYWDSVKLGAIAGLVVGVIIGLILKSMAGKGKKEANEKLVSEVWDFVAKEVGPLLPGKYDQVDEKSSTETKLESSSDDEANKADKSV